ncbi:hypothetical protein K438DRAFT_1966662 [Mycena galopus ATCC 62051]|nr:hypothetical protein K438DRAFT_1966662 [Mycena galopus ATCC 62051]
MSEGYSPKSFETLRLCFPGQHLFPNIKTLDLYAAHQHSILSKRTFSPWAQTHQFDPGTLSTAAHLSLLATLATQCPLLAEVDIKCWFEPLDDTRSPIPRPRGIIFEYPLSSVERIPSADPPHSFRWGAGRYATLLLICSSSLTLSFWTIRPAPARSRGRSVSQPAACAISTTEERERAMCTDLI